MIRKNNHFLEYGDLKYDPDNDMLLYKGSEPNIGAISKRVLILFLSNMGRIIKKDEIYELMQNPTDVALRVMINKIKQQFSLNIINIRGVGYKLENLWKRVIFKDIFYIFFYIGCFDASDRIALLPAKKEFFESISFVTDERV